MNPLTKLRELCSAASPGPWKTWGMVVMSDHKKTGNVEHCIRVAQTYFDKDGIPRTNDADLIAAARTALPVLVDALEKAVATLQRIEKTKFGWDGDSGVTSRASNALYDIEEELKKLEPTQP